MTRQNDVAVVIRQSGERTLPLCIKLVEKQVNSSNIVVIQEVPFSEAVRRTFEIGLDFNLPWTMAIDADVLVKKDSVRSFIDKARLESNDVFSFNVRSHDKFFAFPRYGGPHLYRTAFLGKALEYFPTKETIRPESIVGEILREREGIKNIFFDDVFSLHDYEQYYRDIYRKAYVHAKKHGNNYVISFFRYWSMKMIQDPDFKVALIGLCHGLASSKEINIDIRSLPINYADNDLLRDVEEKGPLNLPDYSPEEDIFRYVNSVFYAREHRNLFELSPFIKETKPLFVIPGLLSYAVNKVSGRVFYWANSQAKKVSKKNDSR